MAQIIDGRALSKSIREEIKSETEKLKEKGITIGLAVILAGDDPASAVYVRNKIKGCEETGIKSYAYYLPQTVSENELIDLIKTLNADKNINGILVQLPLPGHINEKKALAAVDFSKDVDGFHAMNAGNFFLGNDALYPCTPSGCIRLIKSTGENIEGKNAVVIGRSNIVGKPLAIMLLNENATVTICHSKTKNIKEICKNADIICCACGKADFLTCDMVKKGAIIIDVGMNRKDGKLCGDADFTGACRNASYITPVPGGVGPMTITMLLSNTLKAAKRQCGN